jgi:8-hydroxy-5-deazaflavin:NADPH oxidoreductase
LSVSPLPARRSWLIRAVGFNAIDAGALQIARYLEPCSLLLAELAYNGSGGPELVYRFDHLPKRK